MKPILRTIFTNTLSLFIVSSMFSGLQITGGFGSILYIGAWLSVLTLVLDPIVKVIILPLNILTLGLLSFLTTLVSLILIAFFYKNLHVTNFVFSGFSFLGINIGQISFSGFLPIIAISATIYFLNKLIGWLFGE
ncbi:MAG TPA: phage holin family protein [Patescibacteria group bacterium]|nr:phage holin family protein [Patescibacteria group bacterium]